MNTHVENLFGDLESSAVFDKDHPEKWRYQLLRIWDAHKPRCNFLLLNPSTADHKTNDPTVCRCIAYAHTWGFGSLEVTNIFSFRSTNPKKLQFVDDPIGPLNNHFIDQAADRANLVVCGWGNHGTFGERGNIVLSRLRCVKKVHALKLNDDGQPTHPLYLSKSLRPFAI
jgi:hypothetical protein